LLGLYAPAIAILAEIGLIDLKSIDPCAEIADACFQISDSLRLNSERDGRRVAPR
jgi:hypothetical protein